VANECLFQPTVNGLPFGGVGESGYGSQVGIYGFEAFSHSRATLDSPAWLDAKVLYGKRYPPFNIKDLGFIKKLWREDFVPYPRPGASPSIRMRMETFPWTKVIVTGAVLWALKSNIHTIVDSLGLRKIVPGSF